MGHRVAVCRVECPQQAVMALGSRIATSGQSWRPEGVHSHCQRSRGREYLCVARGAVAFLTFAARFRTPDLRETSLVRRDCCALCCACPRIAILSAGYRVGVHIGNVVPRKGLRVRVPCPPLSGTLDATKLCGVFLFAPIA